MRIITFLLILLFASLMSFNVNGQNPSPNELLLDDFSSHRNNQYRIINDGVMGGLSQSQIEKNDAGHAVYTGHLSLENNGGFASVRILLDEALHDSLANLQAIKIKVRGDGRSYKFRLRTDDRFDGVAYSLDFATQANEWMEVTLPLADFVPQFRGRLLPQVPPVNAAAIRQIGILLGDKKEGNFRLEVAWVKGLRTDGQMIAN